MKFEEALPLLKEGKKLYRKGWNGIKLGRKMYVYVHSRFIGRDVPQYFVFYNGVDFVGWMPSVWDVFAEDWEVVE